MRHAPLGDLHACRIGACRGWLEMAVYRHREQAPEDYLIDLIELQSILFRHLAGCVLDFVYLHAGVRAFINSGSCVLIRRKCRSPDGLYHLQIPHCASLHSE